MKWVGADFLCDIIYIPNITQAEHDALLELMLFEEVIIQEADKGNVVILVDKANYVNKMNSILENKNKFIKLSIDDKTIVKEFIETEDRIRKVLDHLTTKVVLSKEVYSK